MNGPGCPAFPLHPNSLDSIIYASKMSTMSVEDAILASHRKASEVQMVCAVHDRILLDVHQEYQFPVEPEKWAVGLAERLELLNKDYRCTVRSNSQTLATRLRNLYERRAIASLDAVATATQNVAVREMSLVCLSKPIPTEPKVDKPVADLMHDLVIRVEDALELCTRIEGLVPQMIRLYEAHGDVLPLPKRVLLRRNVSKSQRGLDEALTYKQQIQQIMEEWRPYFEVLTSEIAMRRLLDEVHSQKLSTKAFLGEVTPVVDHFRALRNARDDIMNKNTALSLAHESDWLRLGCAQLPDVLVADEISKYDDLLEEAKRQQAPHKKILQSLEDFKTRAMSPQVVVGPSGVDIYLPRLALAYVQFREVHFACNGMTRLLKPLLDALEADLKSDRHQRVDDVITEKKATPALL